MNRVVLKEKINVFIDNIDEIRLNATKFNDNYKYFIIDNKLTIEEQKHFTNQLLNHFNKSFIVNNDYSDEFLNDMIELLNIELNDLNQKETSINDGSKGVKLKNDAKETLTKITPIKTQMKQTQIVYLFEQLIAKKLIDENLQNNLWSLISKYFADVDGKIIKNIHQTKSHKNLIGKGKPKRNASIIEQIVSDTKNIK
jgi:hypothetical protein